MHIDGHLDGTETAHLYHYPVIEHDEMAAAADSSGSVMFLALFHFPRLYISDE